MRILQLIITDIIKISQKYFRYTVIIRFNGITIQKS